MPVSAHARSDIDALIAEFAWRVDHDDGHGVEDLFTPDGTYDMAGWALTGTGQIRTFYDERRDRGHRTSRHVFTGLRLDTDCTDDTASGVCVLTLHARQGKPPLPLDPILIADYSDTYRRNEIGQWLFARRTVTPIFLKSVPSGAED